jgi:hypothetical protein
MFKQIVILLLFIFTLTNSSKAQDSNLEFKASQQSLNLKDFGLSNTIDATPIVVNALKKCESEGIRKLEFPPGTYHFYPTFAPDIYCAITNNDNGLKRTPFPLIGFDSFEIDGNGSEFIFHGKMLPFIIENTNNLIIRFSTVICF